MKNENGQEKSAILKGRTLVNLCGSFCNTVGSAESASTILEDTGYSYKVTVNSNGSRVITFNLNMTLESGKKYLVYAPYKKNIANTNTLLHCGFYDGTSFNVNGVVLDKSYAILTPTNAEKITRLTIGCHNTMEARDSYEINYPVLLEYQDGIENCDIPYFEGMKSIGMPILTTTGKNLFDVKWEEIDNHYISVNPNTAYVFSNNGTPRATHVVQYNSKYETISTNQGVTNLVTSSNTYYITVSGANTDRDKFQIEQGSQATSYEPYQSNTLSTLDDLILRGVGNVADEVDCKSGVLTRHIKEIKVDSTNIRKGGWSNATHMTFDTTVTDGTHNTNEIVTISNLFPSRTRGSVTDTTQEEFITVASSGNPFVMIRKDRLETPDLNGFLKWLEINDLIIQYQLKSPQTQENVTTLTDQDNQPIERMKLFANGYIYTSSSTLDPILEMKGITYNNKLDIKATNGTYTTNSCTLDSIMLGGIICRDGTVVRDSYDVESGLYTKRVFRFTIDEEFIERYRNMWKSSSNTVCFEHHLEQAKTGFPKSTNSGIGIANNMTYNSGGDVNRVCVNTGGTLYVRLLKEELVTYDIDGLLEWVKRNGAIEVAYPMATPQIIHMQPNMTPYVSTRPYQGEINSQGNALESSFLDYTQEESILSPKPLGEGDVLRWEQGSQCYVYENDKDYIPLTDYNQKVGTVLDLEDDEQFVENLEGGEIVVDVPFKEKAVYERELVSHEDTVIYPTIDKLDPDGKVEVDYICGATWQNPDDLSDIQHLGTLREDGQYDVTIRRSGDDEIRLMDGTTHLSLDHEGLNPSEFELTYYNKDDVEVGKYGDTSHMLENTLVDSKLETGMVYGETLVNVLHGLTQVNSNSFYSYDENSGVITIHKDDGSAWTSLPNICPTIKPNTQYTVILYELNNFRQVELCFHGSTITTRKTTSTPQVITTPSETEKMVFKAWRTDTSTTGSFKMLMLEGDYTNYPMDIPYFEGVNSTIVNGFTTTGKNLTEGNFVGGINKKYVQLENGYILDNAINRISMLEDLSGLIPNRQYTLSFDVKFLQQSSSNRINTYLNSSVNSQTIYGSSTPNDGRLTWTFTFQDHFTFLGIYFQNDSTKGHLRAEITNIQIEESTQVTEFELYHSIQHTLPTPITLNKVGDVADTYDVVSGVETRNLLDLVFNGSDDEAWNIMFDSYGTARNRIYGINIPNMVRGSSNDFTGLFITNHKHTESFSNSFVETEEGQWGIYCVGDPQIRLVTPTGTTREQVKEYLQANPLKVVIKAETPQTIQHTLIPSTVEMMQEPTFILPQPLRSVPNGICDRLYWDENKGHYCIEKRIGEGTYSLKAGNTNANKTQWYLGKSQIPNLTSFNLAGYKSVIHNNTDGFIQEFKLGANLDMWLNYAKFNTGTELNQYFADNPIGLIYPLNNFEIVDLPHLNRKLELPTCPDKLPVGYKAVHPKMNPQIGLTIPYKQLNPPSQPQNLDFQMNKEDYVLTWNDVKEARQYNVILNDNVIATTKVPFYNTGEEIHGYILVEAQNEIADNLSKELYVKTVPKAPAQLTVAHNGLTDNYDFEISFIKSTSSLADRYTVQYRVDGGEWIIQDIPADEVDANVKVLWKFSVFEIENQIEVWATATNDMGTNDILPLSTYYMTPTPQWTYRINSREVFLRWVDESPYDTQYKLRYQYKSDGIYRYAHFEGDKEEIGQLYEAVVALAEDDEVTLELCVISDRENLYCKPIKASKALDPNILPPKNFNYRWLSRGLIEFYWEDVYDVDLEYEAIVEHRLSGEISWIEDRRVFSATDTEGTGTIYRLQYQMEDLEEIRVKVRMKWAMNETEWSESLTTVFIPVEGNPPQWIRRTQTQEGLLVEWEAQEYIDSYHVYVKGDGVELQHLETRDNFIYVDIDYSNPIDIEIYEVSRFTGGIEAEPSDSMRFIPHQNKQQMINNIYHPDTLKYELEVNTVQKAQKASYQINDINTTPDVRTREAMDVAISSPFVISYHPLEVDVHQKGVKSYGVAETNIKTLDVKTRETVEVLTFERITDKYGMDFTVYTPFASKYPVNLEINQVRIVCLGDSLTSGHPLYWAESGTGDVTASYPYQLAKRLKNQYEVINKGYGSDTTDRCLARFDKDVLAYSPQYCLYQCGTNDKVYVVVKSFELLGTP